jgi:glycosyltransferase involved in cell wall biosynthesis
MKVTAVIPARNEALNIERVVTDARLHADEVLVIDGHSTDGTREIASGAGANVHKQQSRGKGGAIVEAGSLVPEGVIVFIDADQSHDPSDIPFLAQPIIDGAADLVIGSRMLGGSDELFTDAREFTRLVGGHILTLAISKRFRHPLTDSQNGFRAISSDVLRALHLKQTSFTIEMEMCIEALRSGYRVLEVPTHEFRRAHGESNINAFRLGPKYVWVCTRELLRPTRAQAMRMQGGEHRHYGARWRADRHE